MPVQAQPVQSAPSAPAAQRPAPAAAPVQAPVKPAVEDTPPWEEERPPLPPEPEEEPSWPEPEVVPASAPIPHTPAPTAQVSPAQAAPAQSAPAGGMQGGTSAFWPSFVAGLRSKVPASVLPYLNNPAKVTGVWKNKALTLWTDTEFTRAMLNKPPVLQGLAQAADVCFGVTGARVSVIAGKPPAEDLAAPAPAAQAVPAQGSGDALDALLAFGEKFDNIKIQ